MQKNQNPLLNKRIFWDINFELLDYESKANFVIERVFNRGDVEDIRNCRRYYGDIRIKEALLDSNYISEHRLHLASAILDQPLSAFKCYIKKQLNQAHYPY
ncbi:MAG: hypothetical protein L3J06_04055 [Cyclobacteriaceae bacterium]|nr:hypothetical protein [Cyclobacteriaceae bacterium]